MTSTLPETIETAPGPAAPPRRRRRMIAITVWLAAFVAGWLTIGLPTDPIYLFGWLWAATIAWRIERPWWVHLAFLRDWSPVAVLLIGYNLSRGFADNGVVPHALELVAADRAMSGWATGGQVPTIWLQQHLYDPDHLHWYDVFISWVYFSHFVTALTVAMVLWVRDRARWAAFMRRWLPLCLAGLATYFLYPAAPPWWAAKAGMLEPVARISGRGWNALGMHGAGNMVIDGQAASNLVAAMPSLHSGWALCVVLFFLPSVRRRWWPLLLAYPLAMTFALVYSGEHYMIDVLVGWAYVGAIFLGVGLAERLWRGRQDRRRYDMRA